jgi:hypothetical protein
MLGVVCSSHARAESQAISFTSKHTLNPIDERIPEQQASIIDAAPNEKEEVEYQTEHGPGLL